METWTRNQQQQLFIFSPSCHKWNLTNNYCITATLTKHTTWNTVCYTVPVWLFKSWCHSVRGLSNQWLLSISSTLFNFVPCLSTGAGPHSGIVGTRGSPLTSNATLWKACGTLQKSFPPFSFTDLCEDRALPPFLAAHSHQESSLRGPSWRSWALADHHDWVGRAPHKLCLSLFSWLVVQRIASKSTVLQNLQKHWSLSEHARQRVNRSNFGIFIIIRVNSLVGLMSIWEWGAKTWMFYACKCSQWLRCTERSRASVMLAMRQRRRILI